MTLNENIENLIDCFDSHLWPSKDCKFYGIVDRIENTEMFQIKVSPIIWVDGNEYIEVLNDDRRDVTAFFDVQPTVKMFSDVMESTVRLIFHVDLNTLYPKMTRMEAKDAAIKEVSIWVDESPFEFSQLVTGYTSISDYNYNKDDESNMHPYFYFRFDLTLIHN